MRTAALRSGYYRLPEETTRVMRDGWYDTGDLADVDDGVITVVGRSAETIRRGVRVAGRDRIGACLVPGRQ